MNHHLQLQRDVILDRIDFHQERIYHFERMKIIMLEQQFQKREEIFGLNVQLNNTEVGTPEYANLWHVINEANHHLEGFSETFQVYAARWRFHNRKVARLQRQLE